MAQSQRDFDPLLLETSREYGRTTSLQSEPFDGHSQLRLSDFTGNPTGNPNFIPNNNNNNNSEGNNGRDLNHYLPLYKAALKGDWVSAKKFIRSDHNAVNVEISSYKRTALHVAAGAGHSHFVKKLVKRMPPESLALKDNYNSDTALHLASVAGITDAAMVMVEKNNDLTQIQNRSGWTPLLLCAAYVAKEQKDMIRYLSTVTRDEEPCRPFSGSYGAQLICNITAAGLHDVALYLIQRYPALATARDQSGCSVLQVLAQKNFFI